jgi:hypothetical protein
MPHTRRRQAAMDRKASADLKVTPWKIAVCVAIAIFAAFQLYEWYATGQIYVRRYGPRHYISYAEDPVWFSFIATIYVSAVLLFGVGPLIMLINKIRRRR